jgi:hypothetical protein
LTNVSFLIKELFFADDTEKKPETAPTSTGTQNNEKSAVASAVSVPISPNFVPPVSKISAPVFVPVFVPVTNSVTQPQSLPLKRNVITREDMADAFQHGARALTRMKAVEALKQLGFGKSAAYEALLENGRFSAWLQFAPDGIITWTD